MSLLHLISFSIRIIITTFNFVLCHGFISNAGYGYENGKSCTEPFCFIDYKSKCYVNKP